jgi:hypothetical protein
VHSNCWIEITYNKNYFADDNRTVIHGNGTWYHPVHTKYGKTTSILFLNFKDTTVVSVIGKFSQKIANPTLITAILAFAPTKLVTQLSWDVAQAIESFI